MSHGTAVSSHPKAWDMAVLEILVPGLSHGITHLWQRGSIIRKYLLENPSLFSFFANLALNNWIEAVEYEILLDILWHLSYFELLSQFSHIFIIRTLRCGQKTKLLWYFKIISTNFSTNIQILIALNGTNWPFELKFQDMSTFKRSERAYQASNF